MSLGPWGEVPPPPPGGRWPYLSVVVPAYNEDKRLGPSLDRIRAFVSTKGLPFEIIVVDNGSTDGTAQVASAREGVPVIFEPARGKGAAVRTGMLAANGDYVLFSNADLSTPIEEVDALFAAVDGDHTIAAVSWETNCAA